MRRKVFWPYSIERPAKDCFRPCLAIAKVAAVLLLLGQRVDAAGEPLSASLQVHGAGRSCAPRLASVTLIWNGTTLLEGDLVVRVIHGDELVTKSVVSGLALTPGSQTFGLLLPAAKPQFDGQMSEAQLSFRSGRKVINLEKQRCPMPELSDRNLVVAYPLPLTQEQDVRSLSLAACLDRLYRTKKGDFSSGALRSSICAFRPEDFPNTPEMYCALDLVVLSGDGVSRLRMPQLQALKQWVRGGGAVLLANLRDVPTGHQAFLSELVNGSEGIGAFGFSPEGEQTGPRVVMAHSGNGRIVAFKDAQAVSKLDGLFEDREWRGVQAFVWRLRASQRDSIVKKGKLDLGLESTRAAGSFEIPYRVSQQIMNQGRQGASLHMEPLDMLSSQNFLTVLMPTDMEFVQVKWLVLVLVVLVIMVGPVDYFLLRRLKMQRFTWLTVPLYVAIATVVMVLMANHAMGRKDRRSRLCLQDVDSSGEIVRQNDIYLVVPSSHGRLEEQINSSLIAPVRIANAHYYNTECNAMESPFSIVGRYPQSYTAVARVSQWQPMAWRTMTFQPKDSFAWTLPPAPAQFKSRDSVRSYWRKFKELNSTEPVGAYMLFRGGLVKLKDGHWPRKIGAGRQSPTDIAKLAETPPVAFMSLVAGISPACGSTMEDLAVFDVTDDQQAVLVLAWLDGDVIRVSRTPFYSDPAKKWLQVSESRSSGAWASQPGVEAVCHLSK